MASKETFGVYPHATWNSAREEVCESGHGSGYEPGYVVRTVTGAVPYGRMMPVRQYASAKLAQKFADKLNARH
jgi:hypothetical protein